MGIAKSSLEFRLARSMTVIVSLLWLGGSGLAATSMYFEMQEAFDNSLLKTSYRYAPLIMDYLGEHGDDPDARILPSPMPPENRNDHINDDDFGEDYLMYQVRDAQGSILLRSHNSIAEPFKAPLSEGFYDGDGFRIYTAASAAQGLYIQVAEPLEHRHEALRESVGAQLIPLAILIPAAMLVVIYGVRRGLTPLRAVRGEIEHRGEGNLGPIENDGAPDEIQTITQAVNRLMDRLENALQAERAFAANSAHELRTPIAAALAQTQRLLEELPQGHETIRRARQTEASLKRLSRLAEKLLQLSRAEAGVGASPTGENQPLGATMMLVIEDMKRMAASQVPSSGAASNGDGSAAMMPDIRVDPAAAARLSANMDYDAFAICIRNLIENAIRHGNRAEPVQIDVDGSNIVRVSNGSAPVAPGDLAGLTVRFNRAKTSGEGAGLGLSIVEAILRNTNGRLKLSSPRPGRADGFMAEMVLHQS